MTSHSPPRRPASPGFEHYLPDGGGQDIFEKVEAFGAHLRDHPQQCLEGLGVQLLEAAAPHTEIQELDGERHPVIMLGSNSYLGLSTHPDVVRASQEACLRYGYGMGAVSLYAGVTDLHRELERRIARFCGKQDALLFPSGYGTNVGVISALVGPGDVVINDAYNHASLFDGSRLSGANLKVFAHRNLRHLEKILKRLPGSQRGRLVITDGVVSMGGDLAPLDQLIPLAHRYGARVLVDDAHGLGVVGPSGRGTAEQLGCMDQVDLAIGMLSKAAAGLGGFCAGSSEVINYLRYYARSYFFSTSMPAPTVAGLIEVFKLLEADGAGRDRLWSNVRYMRGRLQDLGFDTGDSASAVIPIIVGDETRLGLLHNDLRRHGVYTNIVSFPAVRRKECRLRLNVMSELSRETMDRALLLLQLLGERHGVIQRRAA